MIICIFLHDFGMFSHYLFNVKSTEMSQFGKSYKFYFFFLICPNLCEFKPTGLINVIVSRLCCTGVTRLWCTKISVGTRHRSPNLFFKHIFEVLQALFICKKIVTYNLLKVCYLYRYQRTKQIYRGFSKHTIGLLKEREDKKA